LDTPASAPVVIVPITRLFCSPSKPRRNDEAVPHVAASIRRFGWQQPIVARRSGEVIAGNTRLKAAQRLGRPKPGRRSLPIEAADLLQFYAVERTSTRTSKRLSAP
jgi:ParB-like chromosome segregation protein Spo0J